MAGAAGTGSFRDGKRIVVVDATERLLRPDLAYGGAEGAEYLVYLSPLQMVVQLIEVREAFPDTGPSALRRQGAAYQGAHFHNMVGRSEKAQTLPANESRRPRQQRGPLCARVYLHRLYFCCSPRSNEFRSHRARVAAAS
jgi:hypothetical protein